MKAINVTDISFFLSAVANYYAIQKSTACPQLLTGATLTTDHKYFCDYRDFTKVVNLNYKYLGTFIILWTDSQSSL